MGHASQPVGIRLLKDINESLTTADVQSLSRSVVKEVIGITDDIERVDFLSASRVLDEDLGRPTASHKDSMVRFIEPHREIRLRADNRPSRDDLHRTAVDDRDLIGGRNVHEDARARSFKLK